MDSIKNNYKRLKEDSVYRETLPYERFMALGPSALTDAELLAIIIRTGTSEMTPVEMGTQLLKMSEKYGGGLSGLHNLTLSEIMSIPGIGEVKGVKLKCIAELSNRIAKSRMGDKVCLKTPRKISDYYMERLCHCDKEHVIVSFLNHQMMLMSDEEISVGTVSQALLSPREIFISAIENRAVYIALLHNHPSGDPSPSLADVKLTQDIRKSGKLLGIELLDHVIIGDHRYYSFLEHKVGGIDFG